MKKYLFCLVAFFIYTACLSDLQANDNPCAGIDFGEADYKILLNKGTPEYLQASPEQLKEWLPDSSYVIVNGLTISHMGMVIRNMNFIAQRVQKGLCVHLKTIEIEFKLDDLRVYLNNQYTEDSCPYQTILDHENYHVRVAQEALEFYAPEFKNQVDALIQNIPTVFIEYQDQTEHYGNSIITYLIKNLQPLISFLNKKVIEKNNEIDTPESYQATIDLCPKSDWKI
jgi:hypothetical protein